MGVSAKHLGISGSSASSKAGEVQSCLETLAAWDNRTYTKQGLEWFWPDLPVAWATILAAPKIADRETSIPLYFGHRRCVHQHLGCDIYPMLSDAIAGGPSDS